MSVQGLIEAMEQMVDLHGKLLQLGREKTQVLVHNQVDQLNQIVHKETQLIKQISEWDTRRGQATDGILQQKGYKPSRHITVSELSKLLFNVEEKQAVSEQQQKLVEVIEKLQQTNGINQQLIEQSLLFIEHSLDLVLGPSEDEAVYRNPMVTNQSNRRPMRFDTKA